MDLYVWEGESKWGLPSIDLKSIQILAYIKFSGAPVTIHWSTNPFRSPCGQFPAFKCSEGCFTDIFTISSYLRKKNFGCDYELSAKQCSDVIAYANLLEEKLYPALIYLWWVEPKSYYDVIHKWYYENIPFPYKFWYPGLYHKNHIDFISSFYEGALDITQMEAEIHRQAQECLTMLSNKLGDKEYFFGRSPSMIDAILFSYLVLLLKVDLKVTVLQNQIKTCPNLSRYVNKIVQHYFPIGSKASSSSKETSSNTEDFPHKSWNLALSGIAATAAMIGYAFVAGLVQVDMGEKGQNGVETEEYDYEDFSSSYQEGD